MKKYTFIAEVKHPNKKKRVLTIIVRGHNAQDAGYHADHLLRDAEATRTERGRRTSFKIQIVEIEELEEQPFGRRENYPRSGASELRRPSLRQNIPTDAAEVRTLGSTNINNAIAAMAERIDRLPSTIDPAHEVDDITVVDEIDDTNNAAF